MHQARAWLLGVTAGLLIGVGFLLSWASGALTGNLNDPNAHYNSAAGFIAGLLALVGILMLPAVWRHYRSARNLRLGLR
jgi:formate/nitrite transporter FocA (FNT family)